MSKFSDHKKPQFDINQYLPEVFKSDVNTSVFDMAFNRHLTKDDTQRVAGIIGKSSPTALVKRQITESTPHRQAYQLAPTMYNKIGSVETALGWQAFLAQLTLMGVDINRLPVWGDTLQFNWVPPINIDMLVNYQDYFWNPKVPGETPQYFTIENRCDKSKARLSAYDNIINLRGNEFDISAIDVLHNQLIVSAKVDDLFISGFVFYTASKDINLKDKFWTVDTSVFNEDKQQTTITLVEAIAVKQDTQPTTSIDGQWWFDTTANILRSWTGTDWTPASPRILAKISLSELRTIYVSQTNCVCSRDTGWDVGLWDDNQTGAVLWDSELFSTAENQNPPKRIDFASEQDWINWNGDFPQIPSVTVEGVPVAYSLWFDTTADQLKQFDGNSWVVVVNNFSALKAQTVGNKFWDYTEGCAVQDPDQWSVNNRWIHKSQVKSFSGVKRAQYPILEFNSTVELSEWSEVTYTWKYRALSDKSFTTTVATPSRLELEPIKGFTVINIEGNWYIYLYDKSTQTGLNVDFTETFTPGFQFRVANDQTMSDVYTVHSSEYAEITDQSPDRIRAVTGTSVMCTIVRLADPIYTSSIRGSTNYNSRIEPRLTSLGDPWKGYHLHWLFDVTTQTSAPTTSQSNSVFLQRDSITDPLTELIVNNTEYTSINFQPATQQTIQLGRTYQELSLSIPNVRQIDLAPKFRYTGTSTNVFATPNSNDLRVYVNGKRQYGTYVELVSSLQPVDYTIVGRIATTQASVSYVTGILFDDPLRATDLVRIEIGSASLRDMGMECVPVRTIEDEQAFALAVANGTQPVYRSLTQYVRQEQTKHETNQYPLFNVYDVVTGEVLKAAPIFSYREDPSNAINPILQRRVVQSDDGRDFDFEQHLIDRDNNVIYGYRDFSLVRTYWYNPDTEQLQFWDGQAWSSSIPVRLAEDEGIHYRRAVVSDIEPTSVQDVNSALWFNTVQNKLYMRHLTPGYWLEQPGVVVSTSDPTLRTIWRHGTNAERSIPQYVDKDLKPIEAGSDAGDWGIVDQWLSNPEHENRRYIKFSQLFTHLNSIVKAQPTASGIQNGAYTFLQSAYNYGLGGTIREHNDSFDTLISAVNVTNITPLGVLEYASQEYASCLLQIRSLFTKLLPTLLTTVNSQSIADLPQFITSAVLSRFEQNDSRAQIFGDSTAFNKQTGLGVKNWIASAAMFGLTQKFQPYLNKSGSIVEVFHHDGHRSNISLTTAELDKISRIVCNSADARVGGTIGKISSSLCPATYDAFVQQLSVFRRGVFWYQVSNGVRTLFRFEMFDQSATEPSMFINGQEVPDGVMYYNTAEKRTYQKRNSMWEAITEYGQANISPMWKKIDAAYLLGQMLVEIETRLFDVTPNTFPVFDYSTLTQSSADQLAYDLLREQRFLAFARAQEIAAPLMNVEYNATNPFTWNYIACTVTTPPHADPVEMAGSWQQLYTNWYGTPYPHLEPWKLQGFDNKPSWWDATYADNTGTRRWKYVHSSALGAGVGMWENIRSGRVPAGELLPNGIAVSSGSAGEVRQYAYFSVNIGNNPLAGIAADELLPPYFSGFSNTDLTLRSLFTNYTTEINAVDLDYTFGDGGPVEWKWRTSITYPYDIPMIAFMMQPARFLHSSFGPEYVVVDGLQVDKLFKQVYSHQDALFHGDIYNTNQTYLVSGLNQWYVNYNRSSGFDTNGEFRSMWVQWAPRQTYQFGGIIDTSTFDISNKYMDIVDSDYNIILVNNGVFRELWVDAFQVSLLNIPPPIIQYNNESQWKIEVNTLAHTTRPINYYGVKAYNQMPDPVQREDLGISAITYDNAYVVCGNVTSSFLPGADFDVVASTGNDGNFTVSDVKYLTKSQWLAIYGDSLDLGSCEGATFIYVLEKLPTPPPPPPPVHACDPPTFVDNPTIFGTIAGTFVMGGFYGSSAAPDGHAIASSTDGINWIVQDLTYTTNIALGARVAGLVSGPIDSFNGFVAIASDRIIRSGEGATWLVGGNIQPNHATLLHDGSNFVAIGGSSLNAYAPQAEFSPDGLTWTSYPLPADIPQPIGACYAPEINTYVAVTGSSDGGWAIVSTNKSTWTSYPIEGTDIYWSGIEWNGSMFVVVGITATAQFAAATSADGINWTVHDVSYIGNFSGTSSYCEVSWIQGLNRWVAYGPGLVVSSVDGITWTDITPTDTRASTFFALVQNGPNIYIYCGTNGIRNIQMYSWDSPYHTASWTNHPLSGLPETFAGTRATIGLATPPHVWYKDTRGVGNTDTPNVVQIQNAYIEIDVTINCPTTTTYLDFGFYGVFPTDSIPNVGLDGPYVEFTTYPNGGWQSWLYNGNTTSTSNYDYRGVVPFRSDEYTDTALGGNAHSYTLHSNVSITLRLEVLNGVCRLFRDGNQIARDLPGAPDITAWGAIIRSDSNYTVTRFEVGQAFV